MQAVLDKINPHHLVRKLNGDDLHLVAMKNKTFVLKQALVIRFDNTNHIVSSWFGELALVLEMASRTAWLGGIHANIKKIIRLCSPTGHL